MTDKQTELTTAQQAYRALAAALWNTLSRASAHSEPVPDYLFDLTDAFALADEKGSVCVQWRENEKPILANDDIEALLQKHLMSLKPSGLNEPVDPTAAFILDRSKNVTRIYMQRHFVEERDVAEKILALAAHKALTLSEPVKTLLERFNTMQYGAQSNSDDLSRFEQQGAVAKALQKHFFIITGGPGTGKTTVVAKLLECLLIDKPELKIALAAPTGKATSRIMQSLIGSCQRFSEYFPQVMARIEKGTLPAQTIHKWLLSRDAKAMTPSKTNPLDVDVMIIDEASMIDLRLAKRLLNVIDSNRTRLILLGDKYQLSAVGPGSVLADFTSENGVLSENVAELTVSHRFTSDSNVGLLAQAIKTAQTPFNIDDFIEHFKNAKEGKDAVGIRLYRRNQYVDAILIKWLKPHLKRYLAALDKYRESAEALFENTDLLKKVWQEAERFRVLAAQRVGPNGVNALNDAIEKLVRAHVGAAESSLFYPGRLVIIRKNTPTLDVYNGDVGIVIAQADDPERYDLYIGDREKRIPVGLLPEHDSAFALTIHQSQGSQFEHVAVLLPVNEGNPLATRELFYTGVTRAQKEAMVFGTKDSIEESVLQKTERASGLADRLANN